MSLCDFELDVIRCVAGLPQDTINGWGAALGAYLGPLKGGGYLKKEVVRGDCIYSVTEKGLAAVGAQNKEG